MKLHLGSPLALVVVVLALGCGAQGCASARTEVIVVVDTDLRSGPSALDVITIDVTSPAGAMQSADANLGAGEPPLPRTLGLVHRTGALGPFRVRAAGFARGVERIAREASFSFIPGRTLVLRMDLLGSCVSVACRANETCAEAGCRSVDIAASELLPWTGTAPGLDAAAAPSDAGPPDAGRDAPGLDAALDAPLDAPAALDAGRDAPSTCVDVDGDSVPAGASCDGAIDCDDGDPLVFPGAPELCNTTDDDCDTMVDEDFALATDELNCGACGAACDFQNSTGGACTGGVCVLGTCNAGFDDCNTDGADGCEVELAMNDMNCGSCGNACGPPDRVCCASVCGRTCP